MALKKKAAGRRKGTIINFSGVESGRRSVPDGDYTAEITSAEVEESSSGNPMIAAKWKITEGKCKGAPLFDNISLVPQALWKLKTLLEVVGIDAEEEDKAAEEYASELLGMSATITVTNEKYEGEDRPKVTAYVNGEAEEEDEEEPKVRNKLKAKSEEADEDEDEDEEEAEEEDEEEADEKPAARKGAKKARVKEGSRVKFDDGEGHIIKGTVTSLDDGTATVEDKNGDEYEIDADDVTPL